MNIKCRLVLSCIILSIGMLLIASSCSFTNHDNNQCIKDLVKSYESALNSGYRDQILSFFETPGTVDLTLDILDEMRKHGNNVIFTIVPTNIKIEDSIATADLIFTTKVQSTDQKAKMILLMTFPSTSNQRSMFRKKGGTWHIVGIGINDNLIKPSE